MRRTTSALFPALLLLVFTVRIHAAGDSAKIHTISIYGNKITKESTVRAFLTVDTGMVYDSARAAESKEYLMGTGLFSKVDIVAHRMGDGVRIFVILTERPYWTVSDIGGETYSAIYGHDITHDFFGHSYNWFWWRVRLGIANTNFRGTMEQIDVRGAIWKGRALSASWRKPILKTPYSVKLTASVDYRPDLRLPFDRLRVFQATTAGRRMGKKSLLYGSLMPELEQRYWHGGPGVWTVDSVCDTASSPPACTLDSTWVSYENTMRTVERRDAELYALVGWVTDRRNSRFDTRSGLYFSAALRTNAFYPRHLDYTYAYVQLDTDTRFYHRGFFESNTVAYRFRATVRVDSAGSYDGLYAGGESTLRGYPLSYLPRAFVANNRVLFAAEYRIPLFTTPSITYPRLSQLYGGLRDFYYRVDAAGMFDCAYLWHYITDPVEPWNKHVYGCGAGAGLRLIAPTLSHSLCADFAWPVDRARREYVASHYDRPWAPSFYLYLDMYF